MKVTLWGTRGSLAAAGPETVRYGGNTSCVEVRASSGAVLVLDAGTGARRLGAVLAGQRRRVDLLLSHLHMDHIQGLGFFAPLFEPGREVHLWGPPSTTLGLRQRLARYLSPPLFPVRLSEVPCRVTLHDVPLTGFEIGPFHVEAELVCHPGPTVGYRVSADGASMAYLPDHEPALGRARLLPEPDWVSGVGLGRGGPAGARHAVQRPGVSLARGLGPQRDRARPGLRPAGRGTAAHHLPPRLLARRRHPRPPAGRGVPGVSFPFELLPGMEGVSVDLDIRRAPPASRPG